MDQYIGKFLDNRYEIMERIGTGGMAVVYKAKCHWLNRFVAVKILKEDLAQDEEFRRRFHDESQAVAMLSHPNIVAVYDVSRSSELDYIVMELIDGITLKQYMQKKGGKLSWKEALHFTSEIMKALSHAHGRGIIHRDIKPHNIMVLRDGSVKVADFGIARLMSSSQSTMTQEALGSVHYISPEQARGSHIDARSDIYSAGVVLYEMLTGRLPYEGDSPVAVAIQHINSIPLSPRELDPSIPEPLEEITMKAMASSPDKRYVSADAMLADLEEFRKNPNISFDYTPADLLASDGEEEPTQKLGANSVQVVTARGIHGERKHTHAERSREDEEYYEEGGGGKSTLVIILVALLCLVGVGIFLWSTIFSDIIFGAGETFAVPDLVSGGYTLEQAQALPGVVDQGFTVEEGEYVISETVEAGKIISQKPEANTQVKVGDQTITVSISLGKSGLKLDDYYNQDRRVAESSLNSLGLVPVIVEENSSEISAGHIISQTPQADEYVEKGSAVTLVVSLGPKVQEHVMIPLLGLSLAEATRIVTEDLHCRLAPVEQVASNEYPEGTVCFQSTPVDTMVAENTIILLKVSTGPEMTLPPNASHSPAVEESVPPTETSVPTPTPQPTPTAVRLSRKSCVVDLPSEPETVNVRVTVGGVEQYNKPADTRMRKITVTVEGSGTQEIVVYIDGTAVKSYTEDFGS